MNTINVSLGDNNKPVNVATNVNAVTIAGLNGSGNEIHADTHNSAVNKAIFVKRLASIIYLIYIKILHHFMLIIETSFEQNRII